MLFFYIIFGDRNPPYPTLGSNIPSARRPGQQFHFPQCRGSSPSLRFVNRHGGTIRRAGWFAFTKTYSRGKWRIYLLDFCNNSSHSLSPASLFLTSPSHTSPRPILDVLKSLVSRPQVPSPHTRVPMSPSPCPRPTFIHSRFALIFLTTFLNISNGRTNGFKKQSSNGLRQRLIKIKCFEW